MGRVRDGELNLIWNKGNSREREKIRVYLIVFKQLFFQSEQDRNKKFSKPIIACGCVLRWKKVCLQSDRHAERAGAKRKEIHQPGHSYEAKKEGGSCKTQEVQPVIIGWKEMLEGEGSRRVTGCINEIYGLLKKPSFTTTDPPVFPPEPLRPLKKKKKRVKKKKGL